MAQPTPSVTQLHSQVERLARGEECKMREIRSAKQVTIPLELSFTDNKSEIERYSYAKFIPSHP